MFKQLWQKLSKKRRTQSYLILFLMLIASLSEVFSIGAVLPFLGVLSHPETVLNHPLLAFLSQVFGFSVPTEAHQLVLPLTILFIVAVILSGIIRLVLLYAMTRFSYAVGTDLSIDIYRRTLYQEYSTHMARNSSEVINSIIVKTGIATGAIRSFLTLISSIFFLIGILSVLIFIDMKVALGSSICFGILYLSVVRYTRTRLKENGQIIADESTQMIKSLQEGLGGIRDVIIDGSQEFYCGLYRGADIPLRRATGTNVIIGQSPRYIMEALGMVFIAWIAYVMSQQQNDMASTIPVLGAIALGAQRLLPVVQQLYGAYTKIKGVTSSLNDVLDLLEQPLPSYVGRSLPTPIKFRKEIQLDNVSFRYSEGVPWVLENINLQLFKGSRIGFIGKTGSGKSTLVDIIMGLLVPSVGSFSIDGQLITSENIRAWRARIAHVPQNIYLADSTIEQNIAYGIPKGEINQQLVKNVATQVQIAELIEGWPDGYQTYVGEQGIRLSGGQRQRIGIARALYKQVDVLIFDEATSGLDGSTEQAVMKSIEGLGRDLTILMIAHRLTTLKGCDQIIKIEDKGVICMGNYQDMLDNS